MLDLRPTLRARAGSMASMLVCLLLSAPGTARALEPVTVTVDVSIPIRPGELASSLRDRAFERGLELAVFTIASRYVAPARLEAERDAMEEALAPQAKRLVLNFRAEGAPLRRPSEQDPDVEEFVLSVSATVDADRLRATLEELGFLLPYEGTRPSVVVVCSVESPRAAQARLFDVQMPPLRQFLADQLSRAGFVVVEPALYRPGRAPSRNAVDQARSLGADLAIDVSVRWRPGTGGANRNELGGVVELRARSIRVNDAVELAIARFEAPGYDRQPGVAFSRALGAARVQLASSLVLQLEQNLAAVQAGNGPVIVRLADVSGLAQVESVQRTLVESLGAREAQLQVLEPRSAQLRVDASLSPGALMDRLSQAAYQGFQLEPVEVASDHIALRVAPDLRVLDDGRAGAQGTSPDFDSN